MYVTPLMSTLHEGMMNDDHAAGHAAFSSPISVADCDVQAFIYAHAAAGHSCAVRGKTATDRNASALNSNVDCGPQTTRSSSTSFRLPANFCAVRFWNGLYGTAPAAPNARAVKAIDQPFNFASEVASLAHDGKVTFSADGAKKPVSGA